jgi:hypothetical protein
LHKKNYAERFQYKKKKMLTTAPGALVKEANKFFLEVV